ncbi:MAG: hypothetical protein QOI11_1794, partial [Candidatus Eremiobacteraeota bacterium]|nr:hypothetical protein [Candidatus Eremiobacteraeota bacterium]
AGVLAVEDASVVAVEDASMQDGRACQDRAYVTNSFRDTLSVIVSPRRAPC